MTAMGDPREGWPDEFDALLEAIRNAPVGSYMPDEKTVGPEVVQSTLITPDAMELFVWHIDVPRVKHLGRELIRSNVRVPFRDGTPTDPH